MDRHIWGSFRGSETIEIFRGGAAMARVKGSRRFVMVCLATVMLLGWAGFEVARAGTGGVFIDNGTIQLGVWNEGHLNVPGGPPSLQGTTEVGLRYLPTGAESTAPGCLCEGWGVGDALTSQSGYANEESCSEPVTNLVVESFTSTASTATSVVKVNVGGSDIFRVTHAYFPSPLTPYLYQVDVTIENISGAPTEVLYRRVMDWDIEPTAFDEFVTINAYAAGDLYRTDTNGFNCSDPFSFDSFQPGPVTDAGPDDHGALFDFNFGLLGPGESKNFTTFYGAAGTTADIVAALMAVNAEIYSLGKPNKDDAPDNNQNTFAFAFKGVGAPPAFHTPKTGEVIIFEDGDRRTHFMTTYQDEYGNDHITDVELRMTKGTIGGGGDEVILHYNVDDNLITMEETYLGVTKARGQCLPGQYKMLRGKLLNLNCLKTNVVASENTLKVQWLVKARKTFKGTKNLYLWVKDEIDATDGYNLSGTWYSGE